MATRIERIRFPTEETHPGFDKLKRLAAKVGRSFYEPDKHRSATEKLREYMRGLPISQLAYYRDLIMLVCPTPHAYATGSGAYWAVASRVVNEVADDLWQQGRRDWQERHGNAMFAVVE